MIADIIRAVVKRYPEITPHLTQRAHKIAQSMDAPDNKDRRRIESRMTREMRQYLKRQLERLALAQKNVPFDFWESEARDLFEILYQFILEAAVNGARYAFDNLPPQMGVSWDIVNGDAITWAQKHTAEVVAQISKTSMNAFLEKFGDWVESGEPLDVLIKNLQPYYGEVRAEMVAVTETTRAYAEGNIAVWRNSGVVQQFNVFTAEDDVVCEICEGKQGENPHSIDADRPPFHVRCRCWLQPIVEL